MAVQNRYVTRRRRPYGTLAVLFVVAVGLVAVLLPLSRGEPLPDSFSALGPWLLGEVQAAEPEDNGPREGRVRVFVSGTTIPAYSKVTRDHLYNPAKGTWAYSDVDENLVESAGVLADVKDIVGRVLAKEKPAGYVFTDSDFLPKGTRPGLAAGVPAGKRALRIEVGKVHGIVGLQPGDRFDVVAAMPVKNHKGPTPDFGGVYSELLRNGSGNPAQEPPQAEARVLVQNGVVVSPLQTRQVPTTSASLTSGRTVRTLPVQEMVIALDPEEVAPFLEAQTLDATITCLARSGRPDDPPDSLTPSSAERGSQGATWGAHLGAGTKFPGAALPHGDAPMAVVESIDDQDRQWIPVPSGAGGER